MKTETIVMCVVALILGMLMANMLKSVCGCKNVEGQNNGVAPGFVFAMPEDIEASFKEQQSGLEPGDPGFVFTQPQFDTTSIRPCEPGEQPSCRS